MCLLAPRFISLSQKLSRQPLDRRARPIPEEDSYGNPEQRMTSLGAALEQYLEGSHGLRKGWSALSSLSRVSTLFMQEQLHGYESLCSMWKVSNRASMATAC